jgi:dCTP deaminase
MLLSTEAILQVLSGDESQYGHLRIIPPPPVEQIRNSGSASIDLRLGRWFLLLREARTALLDIDDKQDPRARELTPLTKTTFVPFRERFILHPRKFVLGITLEWISLPSRLGGYVTGKSSWGRRGLVIETAAGIHPGFSGCLTLELANMGEVPIALKAGIRSARRSWHDSGGRPLRGGPAPRGGIRPRVAAISRNGLRNHARARFCFV